MFANVFRGKRSIYVEQLDVGSATKCQTHNVYIVMRSLEIHPATIVKFRSNRWMTAQVGHQYD